MEQDHISISSGDAEPEMKLGQLAPSAASSPSAKKVGGGKARAATRAKAKPIKKSKKASAEALLKQKMDVIAAVKSELAQTKQRLARTRAELEVAKAYKRDAARVFREIEVKCRVQCIVLCENLQCVDGGQAEQGGRQLRARSNTATPSTTRP